MTPKEYREALDRLAAKPDQLRSVAARLMSLPADHANVKDVVQHVLEKLWTLYPDRIPDKLMPYAVRSVRHRILDLHRMKKEEPTSECQKLIDERADQTESVFGTQPPPDTFKLVEHEQLARLAVEALSCLDAPEQAVIKALIAGDSVPQVARQFDITNDVVRGIAKRGLAKLRERLDGHSGTGHPRRDNNGK